MIQLLVSFAVPFLVTFLWFMFQEHQSILSFVFIPWRFSLFILSYNPPPHLPSFCLVNSYYLKLTSSAISEKSVLTVWMINCSYLTHPKTLYIISLSLFFKDYHYVLKWFMHSLFLGAWEMLNKCFLNTCFWKTEPMITEKNGWGNPFQRSGLAEA